MTAGCEQVQAAAPVVTMTARPALALAQTKHEWKYCHVHEADKNRRVKTSKMVEKSF